MSIDEEVSLAGSFAALPPRREFAAMPDAELPHRQGVPSGRMLTLWALVLFVVFAVVLIAVEPMFQQREQSLLLADYRTATQKAANQSTGLAGVETATTAPEFGSGVGILEIGAIPLQQVIVEGASAPILQNGPGHVPGTAGPGQPGNSVIVGRSTLFGAPFGDLSAVDDDDLIAITTTQGQAVYRVVETGTVQLTSDKAAASRPAASTGGDYEPILGDGRISINALYGPTSDDRLTLLTSASVLPFNSAEAHVVIASLEGKPYAPTPQNGRSARQTGTSSDTSHWPLALLAALCLGTAILASVILYRRSSPRIAYLLTVPPLLVFSVLAAETMSQLLPAWY